MGRCQYCGRNVGILRRVHPECKARYESCESAVWQKALAAARGEGKPDDLFLEVDRLATRGFISADRTNTLLVAAWENTVSLFLDDGILSEQEEAALLSYQRALASRKIDLNGNIWTQRAAVGGALRDLAHGNLPTRLKVEGPTSFNLQKSETLVWMFPRTEFYEQRTKREYVGGYQGVSMRISKGLYYRVGGFKGHPVDTSFLGHVDTGTFGLTDRHIYFSGATKGFRIPYRKIASFRAHEDGITVNKQATTARPLVFLTGDGWSTYNLVVNLARNAP